jgi:putative thiazole-containing bacteriocin maturation protein
MRLKVKGDTFYLPDPNGGVYFRNNAGSFRMEGDTLDQWIEKLMPMWNGEHSMEDLTDGLPDPYRKRVYEIAEVMFNNGFVRDVSQDRPHSLSDAVVREYASQIEFLDSFGGSGAYRFQTYRQANMIAVGSGPILVSLVAAILESGLPRFRVLITNPAITNRQRISELAAFARQVDQEVDVEEIFPSHNGILDWREVVRPVDSVLYVSQEDGLEECRALHAACRESEKIMLPAIYFRQMGMAGPLVHPDSEGCFESAWRRVHHSALYNDSRPFAVSSTAEAMLATVLVFEWLKTVTGATVSELQNKLFLMNPETLEGDWHPFLPHPLVNERPTADMVPNIDIPMERSLDKKESSGLLPYFSSLTSSKTGILHMWEEGNLRQLPLSQCRVQATDPLTEGPAVLLPEIICSGLTHNEARREAGLAGIEAYVSRMAGVLMDMQPLPLPLHPITASPIDQLLSESFGVGTGETVAEGVCRGLQKVLAEELGRRLGAGQPSIFRIEPGKVEDERSLYYLRALTTMQGAPVIGLGEEVAGFPVVWVGTNGYWFGGAGLNLTLALRKALQHALMIAENNDTVAQDQVPKISTMKVEEALPLSLIIPGYDEMGHEKTLQSALQVLSHNRKRIMVFDLAAEPFMKEELAGVFGVSLREEESR